MAESTWWKFRRFWDESIFIPNPEFNAEDIPDLSSKVMIVTGGNTGIGKETVKVSAKEKSLIEC